jgi:hypothetical protein
MFQKSAIVSLLCVFLFSSRPDDFFAFFISSRVSPACSWASFPFSLGVFCRQEKKAQSSWSQMNFCSPAKEEQATKPTSQLELPTTNTGIWFSSHFTCRPPLNAIARFLTVSRPEKTFLLLCFLVHFVPFVQLQTIQSEAPSHTSSSLDKLVSFPLEPKERSTLKK